MRWFGSPSPSQAIPATACFTLLNEGVQLSSVSTMYRILRGPGKGIRYAL